MERRRGGDRPDPSRESEWGSHERGGPEERLGGFWDQPPDPREASARPQADGAIVVLIPIFNDWESLAQLLPTLDDALASCALEADVLVVDDGSIVEPGESGRYQSFVALHRIDVLRLKRNLGHQRAITIGLAYVEDCLRSRAVVVMDGDGEDDPADVPRLLRRLEEVGHDRIVFAERTQRSESLAFRIFYALYRLLHHALTGRTVRVGNFSAIPLRRLSNLVIVTEIWNHYAAGVIRSGQPYCAIPTRRSGRLRGRSTMNFVSLVTHGLSAISVYSDVVGVRLLVVSVLLALLTLGGILAAVLVRLATAWAVPGWATSTVGLLMVLLGQAVVAAFVFSFVVLGARNGSPFLPRRDYSYFVGSVWPLHGDGPSVTPLPSPELTGVVTW